MNLEKYLIPAEEGFIINALKRMGEKQKAKNKKEHLEKIAKEKASVNVDEFYSQFHVTPGNRDQLRSTMYNMIEKETEKIVKATNRNKSIVKGYIDKAIKELYKNNDDKEYIQMEIEYEYTGDFNFTCEDFDGEGFFIGEEFGQSGCVYVVCPYVEEMLIPQLKKVLPNNIFRVVDIYYGGDGDEGFMAVNFKF